MKIEINQGCMSDDIKVDGVSLTYLANRNEIEAKVLEHILPELKKRVLAGNISITNVLGQVVVAENLTQSEALKQIDISKLTNGNYYLTYSSSNYRTTTIFVKK